MARYVHTQSTPATSWIVTHNLNSSVVIEVFFEYEGEVAKVLPLDIQIDSPNEATITFTSAQVGLAVVIGKYQPNTAL